MGLRDLQAMYSLHDHPDVRDVVAQNMVAAKKDCDAKHRHETVENEPGYTRVWCKDCKTYV